MDQGKVIIFCAPSGSGKTTIVKHLTDKLDILQFSISATTRKPRGQEQHGKDYYFLTKEDFEHKIIANEFVEYEEVYSGTYYGTLKEEVQRIWSTGKTLIADVDVVGGINLKKYFGDQALAVFVQPPSVEELERRLRTRATDDEESLKKRIEKSAFELSFAKDFDTILLNDQLDTAFKDATSLVNKFIAG